MSLDDIQFYFCEQQQELFEYVQQKGANIQKFTHDFMCSKFCNCSLDLKYSVDQFADIVNWLEFIEAEFNIQFDNSQNRIVPLEVAGWLGFTYRQLQIESGLKSRELIKRIPFDRLVLAYEGLHTVDIDMAGEIVMNDFDVPCVSR